MTSGDVTATSFADPTGLGGRPRLIELGPNSLVGGGTVDAVTGCWLGNARIQDGLSRSISRALMSNRSVRTGQGTHSKSVRTHLKSRAPFENACTHVKKEKGTFQNTQG